MTETQGKNRISEEAVKRATGKGWQEWFRILDEAGAAKWSHKQIAQWLSDQKLIVSGWWCQGVTVEYEKARGLRMLGETAQTGFEVGVRKTLPTNLESTWQLIRSAEGVAIWLGGGTSLMFRTGEQYRTSEGVEGEIRTVLDGARLRLTWQPTDWAKPSTVQIYLTPSKSGTSVGFHQEKLDSAERREEMRRHWQKVLDGLSDLAGGSHK